jgi:hypothetical protein
LAEEADRPARREAAPASLEARRTADAPIVQERAQEDFAPPPVAAAAPPPAAPPPPRSAERGADVAEQSGEVMVTGSLIRNPKLRSESMAARAPSAVAAKPSRDGSYPAFLSQLQSAIRTNDPRKIIGLVELPLRVNFRTGPRTYRDARSVERDFERMFTPKVRRAILDQRPDRLFTNYQGAMVGDGEVWFDHICPTASCSPPGPVRIKAINP